MDPLPPTMIVLERPKVPGWHIMLRPISNTTHGTLIYITNPAEYAPGKFIGPLMLDIPTPEPAAVISTPAKTP